MRAKVKKVEKKAEELPQYFVDLLCAIHAARRQSGLYGSEHKSSEETFDALKEVIAPIVRRLGCCTMIFTKERLIANDYMYVSTSESKTLSERLRARGAMGISFAGNPSQEEIAGFIHFLNAAPSDVRQAGSPGAYLSKSNVKNITAIEAIYTGPGMSDQGEQTLSEDEVDPALLDPAVRALIERTCEQSFAGEAVDVPLTGILSSPDATAKLIWESVIKLHSASSQQVGELGFQVIHNLKGMSANNQDVWDLTTLEIRKAISKLPDEVRSTAFGFISNAPAEDQPVEKMAGSAEAVEVSVKDLEVLDPDTDLEQLFDMKAQGLLSSWQKELQPASVARCSGRTLAMLMAWESDPSEHGRLARALALLIPRGLGMRDLEGALACTESLLREASLTDMPAWRAADAKSALQSLDVHTLRTLIESALASESLLHVVASLIETIPSLALVLGDFLRSSEHRTINESIKRGMVKSGPEATIVLKDLLSDESPAAREAALEVLIQIGTEPAVHEIANAMETADDLFLTNALTMLPSIRTYSVSQVCADYVRHKSLGVRIAALRALGELGDPLALGTLMQAAAHHTRKVDEQIAAIQALGEIKDPNALNCLQGIADRRPLVGRSRYELIRAASLQAINRLGGEIHED